MTQEQNDIILEIYKLHAELADRTSQRRLETNRIFGSLSTGVFLFLGTLLRLDKSESQDWLIFCAMTLAGAALCVLWILLIRSYRQLNGSKFKVLIELEKQLPFSFFEREWQLLGYSEGKDESGRRYTALSKRETIAPIIFLILYVFLCVIAVVSAHEVHNPG